MLNKNMREKHLKIKVMLHKELLIELIKKENVIFLRFEPRSKIEIGDWRLDIRKTIDVQPSKTIILDINQSEEELLTPINDLEVREDVDGIWRRYANEQLRSRYEPVFDRLDSLVFLEAPSFDAIVRWRFEQEKKFQLRFITNSMMH